MLNHRKNCTCVLRMLTAVWMLAAFGQLRIARGDTVAPLSDGDEVQVHEGDQWKDATFVRQEGQSILIVERDVGIKWVPVDQVRLPNGGPLPGVGAAPANSAAPAAAPLPDASGAEPSAPGTAGGANNPLTAVPTPLPSNPILIDVDQDLPAPRIDLQPDAIIHPGKAAKHDFVRFGGHASGLLGSIKPYRRCVDTPDILFNVRDFNSETVISRIDLAGGEAGSYRSLPVASDDVRGVGAGGRYVATVTDIDNVRSLRLWTYDTGQYRVRATVKLVKSDRGFEYGAVWPISGDRLIVDGAGAGLYLVNLPQARIEAYCKHGGDDPRLTPDGKYLIVRTDANFLLVRATDLSIAASVSAKGVNGNISIDPSNEFVAFYADNRVHVVKIADVEEVGSFDPGPNAGDISLISRNYVLMDRSNSWDAYDVATGRPLWNYRRLDVAQSLLLGTGQMFLSFNNGQFALASLPHSKAIASVRKFSKDAYVLTPGTAIAVKGDPAVFNSNQADMKNAVSDGLRKCSQTLAPGDSLYELNWTSAAGPTTSKKFYHTNLPMPMPFGAGVYGEPMDVSAPSTIITLPLTFNGTTIWHREITFVIGDFIQLPKDQSAQDVANQAAKPNVGALGDLEIPPYILKGASPDGSAAPFSSYITSTGIIQDEPDVQK